MMKKSLLSLATFLLIFLTLLTQPSEAQISMNGNFDDFNLLYQRSANITLNSILRNTEFSVRIHLWQLLWGLYSNTLQSVKILKIDFDNDKASDTKIDYNL